MGIGIKDFLEAELLSRNGQGDDNGDARAFTEGGLKFTSTDRLVGRDPRESGGDPRESGGEQRTGHGSVRPRPSYSAPNFLGVPLPNKWRGSKIKVHDKDVIQAQKEERSTQNLRKAQSRKEEIRPEQEQVTNGSKSNAQADSQEAVSTPGNVANGRRVRTTRNGLMSYGLGRSGLKRGKKTNASTQTGPTTPPRPAKPPQPSPKKSPAVRSRVRRSPKKKSSTILRKKRKYGVDSEEECGKSSKRRHFAAVSSHSEEWGRMEKRSD